MLRRKVIITMDWDGCMINSATILQDESLRKQYVQLQETVLTLYLKLEQSLDNKNDETRNNLKIELEKAVEDIAQWCFTTNKALFDSIFKDYGTSEVCEFELVLNSARNNVIAEYCGTFRDRDRGVTSHPNGPCWPVFKVLYSKIKKTYEEQYKSIRINFEPITYQDMIEEFQGKSSTNIFENYIKHFFDGDLKNFANENQDCFNKNLRYDRYKIIFFNFLLYHYSKKEKDCILDILIIDDRQDIADMLCRWFYTYQETINKNHCLYLHTYDGTNFIDEYSGIQGRSDEVILPFALEKNDYCKDTLEYYINEIETDLIIYENICQLHSLLEIKNEQLATQQLQNFINESVDIFQNIALLSSYENSYLRLLKECLKLKKLVHYVESINSRYSIEFEQYRRKLEELLYNLVELFPNEIKKLFNIFHYEGIVRENKELCIFLKHMIFPDIGEITIDDCQRIFLKIVDKNVEINNSISPYEFVCKIQNNGLNLAQNRKIQLSKYPRMYIYDIQQACKDGDIDELSGYLNKWSFN